MPTITRSAAAVRRFSFFHALGLRLAFIGCLLLAPGAARGGENVADAIRHARALSLVFRTAAEATLPSVVTLVVKSKPRADMDRDLLRELLRDPRFRRGPADEKDEKDENGDKDSKEDDDDLGPLLDNSQIGSGVIIDAQGVILTNSHVVADAQEVIVRFPDGHEAKAKEIKTDPLSDLAIVRVEGERSLKSARLGDSSKLAIGDWVIAIGSPFELEATVSAGIISGMGRGIEKILRGKLLQTDAAVNPGNSGGPLVNLEGEVIGVNTAIASMSGGYQGVGFAIPINRAKWVTQELLQHGEVRRASLGIRIDELTPEAAQKLKLPPRSGVFVADVLAGGPAEAAGVHVNDVIVEFSGERVRGPRDLQDAVEQKPLDSKQPLVVMRDGKRVNLTVTLKLLR